MKTISFSNRKQELIEEWQRLLKFHGFSDSLFVETLQGDFVVYGVLMELVVQDDPGGSVGPLLCDINPRGQVVPVEVDVEGFQQSAVRNAK